MIAANDKEAIEFHLEGLIEDGQVIPDPSPVEAHKGNRHYAGGTWALVTINHETLRVNAQRISITMPLRALDAIDRYAREHGQTRSGLRLRAAMNYIGRAGDAAIPTSNRGRPRIRRTTKGR